MKSMIGEALAGEGNEVAHIDLAIGLKGTPFETAFMSALTQPAMGHTPLLAVLEPNLPCKPSTLMANKVTIKNGTQALLMFGPAQAAVANAVTDCVAEGVLPKGQADEMLLIVSVFIHWDAKDKKKIYDYNYEATKLAIRRAFAGEPKIDEILARRKIAKHPFA